MTCRFFILLKTNFRRNSENIHLYNYYISWLDIVSSKHIITVYSSIISILTHGMFIDAQTFRVSGDHISVQ